MDYIDQQGLAKLTMRSLASELDVEATSLYKHVAHKEDLQTGVAELVWEEIARSAPPDDDWSAWISSYAHAIRDVIHRHPGTLPLWVTQPVPPVPALELFDAQLQRCPPDAREEAANALRVIGSFAIGYASNELSWFTVPDTQPPESDAQRIGRIARTLPPDAPDRLLDTALLLCAGDTIELFESGLDLMMKGLALSTA